VIYLYLDRYAGNGPLDIPPEVLKDAWAQFLSVIQ
jgi:hypothetical protein